MCVIHEPELLKKWKPKKSFIAYKVITRTNISASYEYQWLLGLHKTVVRSLHDRLTSQGFYVYIDRESAFFTQSHNGVYFKVVAVHIDPKDVVYAGHCVVYAGHCAMAETNDRVFICRRVTIKSLRGLRGLRRLRKAVAV